MRLLSTLASSLSVALENARLFDETKRLLTETDERAAELAIINSVQEGLAQKLDMQAMYDLVGDKIREIFDAQVVDIGIYDTAAGTISFPYSIERGERLPNEVIPIAESAMSTHRARDAPAPRTSATSRHGSSRDAMRRRPSRASRPSRCCWRR